MFAFICLVVFKSRLSLLFFCGVLICFGRKMGRFAGELCMVSNCGLCLVFFPVYVCLFVFHALLIMLFFSSFVV